MATLQLKLVTPERVIFDEEFNSVTLPTESGQITILPNHAPLVATLLPGEFKATINGEDKYVHLSGGFVTVEPKNSVVILADAAEHVHEIDEERAKSAVERAKTALTEKQMSAEEIAETEAALIRGISRLKLAKLRRHRTHGTLKQD